MSFTSNSQSQHELSSSHAKILCHILQKRKNNVQNSHPSSRRRRHNRENKQEVDCNNEIIRLRAEIERRRNQLGGVRVEKASLMAQLKQAKCHKVGRVVDHLMPVMKFVPNHDDDSVNGRVDDRGNVDYHYNREYVHVYDRAAVGAIDLKDLRQRPDQIYGNGYDESILVKQRERRRVMGAHRLSGVSLFTILDEGESGWYIGARIDVNLNGFLSRSEDVYFAFFELENNIRWRLKSHSFPHNLRMSEFVDSQSQAFAPNIGSASKLVVLGRLLRKMRSVIHTFKARASYLIELKAMSNKSNIEIQNIASNSSLTLLSFEVSFNLMSSSNSIFDLKVKAQYNDHFSSLPTNVEVNGKESCQGLLIISRLCDILKELPLKEAICQFQEWIE